MSIAMPGDGDANSPEDDPAVASSKSVEILAAEATAAVNGDVEVRRLAFSHITFTRGKGPKSFGM